MTDPTDVMIPWVVWVDAVLLFCVLWMHGKAPAGWVKSLTAVMAVYVTVEMTLHKLMEDGVAYALVHLGL